MLIAGVDIAQLINDVASPMLEGTEFDMVLQIPTQVTVADGSVLGTWTETVASHACRGFFAERTERERERRAGETIVLFGAGIEGGAIPLPGHRIVAEGKTYEILPEGVSSDPVRATYSCAVMAAG